MKINIFCKKLFIYIAGLFFLSLGSNLAIISGLGVSPINSIPYSVSLFSQIPLGTCVTSVFGFYIVLQILILRKDFKLINLTQLIFAGVFGYFVSLTGNLLSFLKPEGYIFRLLLLLCSIFIVALGVSLYMSVKLINLPAEGLTAAIAQKASNVPFHTIKIIVDCSFVGIAALISFITLKEIVGIREGTILAAIFVGKVMPITNKVSSYIIGLFFRDNTELTDNNCENNLECS